MNWFCCLLITLWSHFEVYIIKIIQACFWTIYKLLKAVLSCCYLSKLSIWKRIFVLQFRLIIYYTDYAVSACSCLKTCVLNLVHYLQLNACLYSVLLNTHLNIEIQYHVVVSLNYILVLLANIQTWHSYCTCLSVYVHVMLS